MDRYLQLHLLTSYPPSNLNRDDLGRPKTAMMGGATRLRISSQSLKRAWRTSDVFLTALAGNLGTRTKRMGEQVAADLVARGASEAQSREWARLIAGTFGKLKQEKKDDGSEEALHIEQLAHFSPEEIDAIEALVVECAANEEAPNAEQLKLLREKTNGADVALFGRMIAASPRYNIDAAAQVAHAITVHKVAVEDDFFTAVDDLNSGDEDAGAGHMGETEFGAGLFYLYCCVDRQQLVENLNGDEALANKTLAAFVEATATVSPSGKQNSFASRARASYILCETGNQQPRSLSVAYLEPVGGVSMLSAGIACLQEARARMDQVYGACASNTTEMNAHTGDGSLGAVIACAQE